MPAEWTAHDATWLAWPSHRELWREALEGVRAAFVDLSAAIGGPAGGGAGERLEVLVPDEASEASARAALAPVACRFHRMPFGDIWLRDTAPLFLRDADGKLAAASFRFNGWGGKYDLPGDAELSQRIAAESGLAAFRFPFILEGGAIEVDGGGTCLTTRQCLLNPNRNPDFPAEEIEARLADALGVTRVLWLEEGLQNDHTDGHVDTLARFVAPGVVVCMEPTGAHDPNRDALARILEDLRRFEDAAGRRMEIVTVPSPGRVVDRDARLLPASYVNFYIANRAVVVPVYGVAADDEAVRKIAALFPARETVPVSAKELLEGGGAFHCITQQQPRALEVAP